MSVLIRPLVMSVAGQSGRGAAGRWRGGARRLLAALPTEGPPLIGSFLIFCSFLLSLLLSFFFLRISLSLRLSSSVPSRLAAFGLRGTLHFSSFRLRLGGVLLFAFPLLAILCFGLHSIYFHSRRSVRITFRLFLRRFCRSFLR